MQASIDTAIVFTNQMRALAEFYAAGLNLPDPLDAEGHVGFQVGEVYLGFDQVDRATAGGSAVTLWFRVDDLDATFAAFVDLGARVVYPPVVKPWGDRLAAVLDPDGNRVGLSQRQ